MYAEYFVTDIKELTSKRRLIYINYEPAFALYPTEIRRFHIKNETVISRENYSEITEQLLVKRAKLRAMSLLKSKDYTVSELTKKLKDTYYPDIAVNAAIEYVSSFGYLNDYRYAENYVTFKAEHKSRKQIEFFLYNKGIDKELIKEVCDLFYEKNSNIELEQAVKALRKKIGTKDISDMDYSERNKLSAYLYRHGFSMDDVRKALDIVVNDKL